VGGHTNPGSHPRGHPPPPRRPARPWRGGGGGGGGGTGRREGGEARGVPSQPSPANHADPDSPHPPLQVCKAAHMHPIKRCKHFEIGGEKKTKGAAY